MKTAFKTAIKILVFVALVLALMWYLMQVFTYPKSVADTDSTGDFSREKFNTFYSQKKNTLDCVFLGTSGTDRYWLTSFAWHDKGLATFALTTPSQHITFTKNLIKEVYKTQDPDVIVIDLRMTIGSLKKRSSPIIRRVTDNMKISPNWVDTILTARKMNEGSKREKERLLSYLFTPYKYHSMWTTMTLNDYIDLFPEDDYMSYFGGEFAYQTAPQKSPELPVKNPIDIPEENKAVIDDLAEFCKGIDAKVIFISSPISSVKKVQRTLKPAADYVRSAGFEVYDFNTYEMYDKMDWDFQTDMYDARHANFKGALKFTDTLGDILINEYGLKDRRNDPDTSCYAKWERAHDLILDKAKKYMPEVYEKLVS